MCSASHAGASQGGTPWRILVLVLLAALLLESQQHAGQAAVGLGQGLGLGHTALLPFPGLLVGRGSQLHKVQPGSLWYALQSTTGLGRTMKEHHCIANSLSCVTAAKSNL